MASAVRSLVNALNVALRADGGFASFANMGGFNMAVLIEFGPVVAEGVRRFEVVITDREDTFGVSDEDSNDDISGFEACLYVNDGEGSRFYDDRDPVIVYETTGDGMCLSEALDGEPVVNLGVEVQRCAAAVESVVWQVLWANTYGRGDLVPEALWRA